ncbi:MAG: YggS family pyridoxal phosphate-dependent enzyme [Candidatus Atribacteria bacterium]|nr:YggS family pyridoxal phosphate-dependent enzyme [Candidatus Atribacteria bacterium]
MSILESYQRIRSEIPSNVKIIAAAKTRTVEEVKELIDAGITDIGENYVQEAEEMIRLLGPETAKKVNWHMIGHLQKNKINKAIPIFDTIQTVDSLTLAQDIDERVEKTGKKYLSILLEINIGSEFSKDGIMPDEHIDFEDFMEKLVIDVARLTHIHLNGLMTMGPRFDDPEKPRPFFRRTKKLFDRLKKLQLERVDMQYLSMGMSNSYHVAIEEGANLVRIGTAIFGARDKQ